MKRPENQYMLYVNSQNRQLTNSTVRRVMYDIDQDDLCGEEFAEFYTADYFYSHMREYFLYVADLYMKEPQETDTLETIIDSFPSMSGWITLIVENLETFTGNPKKMEELFTTLLHFAHKRANVILIGSGDYHDVFSGCDYAVEEMDTRIAAKVEDNMLMVGCVDQDKDPEKKQIQYRNVTKEREELNFYWSWLNKRLQTSSYFDYDDFQVIFNDTFRYLISHVSKRRINRKDIPLIRNIADFRIPEWKKPDGCELWEYHAAKQFAQGLYKAIVNRNGVNDDFSKGSILFSVRIENREIENGSVHVKGSVGLPVEINADNAIPKMNGLCKAMRRCCCEGGISAALNPDPADWGTDKDEA